MLNRYFISILLLFTMLTSCDRSTTNSTNSGSIEKPTLSTASNEPASNNFYDFIEKFSSDTAFQLDRTKFPLKTTWYDLINDRDSLVYTDRSNFQKMDFRVKKSTSQYDQWEQKIVIDKNNRSATIEIRGIENGIIVDYLFGKINGAWMLVEIVDRST